MKCFPNPTTGQTTINYYLRSGANVRIEVRDVSGRSLSVIQEKKSGEGEYSLNYDFSRFGNGIYIVALIVNDKTVLTQKVVLQK